MRFEETPLGGAYLIEPEPLDDDRGFFARMWCRREFSEHGLDTNLAQCNLSYNELAGTLRGMHFQRQPHPEVKLVRCTRGAVWDAIVDLRPDSPTYCRWYAAELTALNRRMLYVPAGFAHGYLTLADDAEVFYQVTEFYHKELEGGVRWDDPAFGIEWPLEGPFHLSPKDRSWPDYHPVELSAADTEIP
ncbi:MAG: dTDP-4-dehydrorhamnose 3,5-epimerase [Candidatus Palauibacterales bacterium]|nr:dTDP-4-dehydrorhamnose 3,5-epimerase [Candidatus Palauibacterales bacterium]